jgi:hypothetical protein
LSWMQICAANVAPTPKIIRVAGVYTSLARRLPFLISFRPTSLTITEQNQTPKVLSNNPVKSMFSPASILHN